MIVLGHRGVTDGSVAENTIDAFAAARDRGANGIETDLQLTKDKRLILFHNHYIGKKHLHELTHEEINSRVGYKVPLLKDLIDWADKDFLLNIEIKNHEAIIEIVDEMKDYQDYNILISSFHHSTAFKVSKVIKADCAVLMGSRPVYIKQFFSMIPATVKYVIWPYQFYDSACVDTFQFENIVYDMGEIRPTKKMYIDGIISDHLDIHVKK